MITVFYDGKCGLCRREISHYKRIAPDAVFHWVDITADSSSLEKLGISYTDGLKLLHATDSQGKLYVGVDAFILIWQQLARWRILAAIVSLTPVRFIAKKSYGMFAAWRFSRLEHCKIT